MLTAVFWDMDGTLIDSEPYWHDAEIVVSLTHGGFWTEKIGWACSGEPVPRLAARVVKNGVQLPVDEVARLMVKCVGELEKAHMPWIPGVENVLQQLADAKIPSVLVTASPRQLAENLMAQAPKGAFVGCVCGDDHLTAKPDPAPYLAAARLVGIEHETVQSEGNNTDVEDSDFALAMAHCIAIEDSFTGLESAAASGATTLAQTAFIPTDTSQGPQFASIDGYEDLTVARLENYVSRRIAELAECIG
ncbi:HAD family hydrolase [Bifidobacterium sp. ESL0732]|uniref:HAD family hydrolase n=1 Tax=Bifidobacterium sp. ESL0732 TaxID=2983222 RepID=UPI0023F82F52|nr:HAD family hydrolase [Bifidobacterium sp. ESL0732]WEV63582.1 HAD family hydrolase [Bifidobacterium sp. ESL0732]